MSSIRERFSNSKQHKLTDTNITELQLCQANTSCTKNHQKHKKDLKHKKPKTDHNAESS